MPFNPRWLLWLAAIVMAVLALLVAVGLITAAMPWLLPAAVVALCLAVAAGPAWIA
jgi:hypothetical protein